MITRRFLSLRDILVLLFAALAWSAAARSADSGETVILVAQPQFQDAIFGQSVLVAKALPDGSSIGFILNKPTSATLGTLFPDDQSLLDAKAPVYLGGLEVPDTLFALVARRDMSGIGSIQIAPDIFLVVSGAVIDQIISSQADHARIFAGFVVWRPGELSEELRRGLWFELASDADLVFRTQTNGMWEELVQRLALSQNAI